jgi:methionyl-tRNA formyltransferase
VNIYILNTLEIGINTINILNRHLDILGIIGLSARDSSDAISGYVYQKGFCKKNHLNFIPVEKYSLSDPSDQDKLLKLDIDVLIVAGWQRLIPPWLISHCNSCVIGSHGSVSGITGGRGRSPQNWALLLGKNKFDISIFKIDKGIDSGPVLDTRTFAISDFDDIRTTYYKVSWLTSRMIIDTIKDNKLSPASGIEQEGDARYLPQRLPEDGQIDWSRSSKQIYDLIRALTRPYPGAFSFLGERKLVVWKARPFEMPQGGDDYKPGGIACLYVNGDMLVKTGDSFLLIEDYSWTPEGKDQPAEVGDILAPFSFLDQMRLIVARHYEKYPDLILSDDILNLVEDDSRE